MASEQFSSGPRLCSMTPATSSSGLVPITVSQQPCIPPIRDDWDHLFQPMFDDYFNPPSIAVSPVQEAPAPRAVVLADSPVSSSIDQDAPSASIPSTQEQEHSSNISQFTWVRFLRIKDEALEAIRYFVNFMTMLASHIKHLLPVLLSRTALSKGKTKLL
nr:hypothetical protein [Tanacetum cinerariifolium]